MRKNGKKKQEREESTGFIGGAGPNEQYTDDDMIQIQVLCDPLVFMVWIFEYTEKQIEDVNILVGNFSSGNFDNEAICRWCFIHGLKFKVITVCVRWTLWKILYYLHLRYVVAKLEKQYANKK